MQLFQNRNIYIFSFVRCDQQRPKKQQKEKKNKKGKKREGGGGKRRRSECHCFQIGTYISFLLFVVINRGPTNNRKKAKGRKDHRLHTLEKKSKKKISMIEAICYTFLFS